MTNPRDLLTSLLPNAVRSPMITVTGTTKADAKVLADKLTAFSLGSSQYFICCLPIAWLACNTPRSKELRNRLLSVSANWLHISAQLPAGAVEGISGEVGLLVLSKTRNDENLATIKFIDARVTDWIAAEEDFRNVFLKDLPLTANYFCRDDSLVRPLSEIADILMGPQTVEGGEEIACLSVKNFAQFGYTSVRNCDVKFYREINSGLLLQEDDIVFVNQGAVGRVAIVGTKPARCVAGAQTSIVRSKKVNAKALYVFLCSDQALAYFEQNTSRTKRSHRVSLAALKSLPVPPFSDEQGMIAVFDEMCNVQSRIYAAEEAGMRLRKRFFAL